MLNTLKYHLLAPLRPQLFIHLVTTTFVQWQKSGDEALPYIVIPANRQSKCEFGSEHNKLIILGISIIIVLNLCPVPTQLGSLEPYIKLVVMTKLRHSLLISIVQRTQWILSSKQFTLGSLALMLHFQMTSTSQYFAERSILSAHNDDVDELNKRILDAFPG